MSATAPAALATQLVAAPAHLRGHEAAALFAAFPPRSNPESWPTTQAPRDEVLERLSLPAFAAPQELAQRARPGRSPPPAGVARNVRRGDLAEAEDASPASSAYDGWHTETISWAPSRQEAGARSSPVWPPGPGLRRRHPPRVALARRQPVEIPQAGHRSGTRSPSG